MANPIKRWLTKWLNVKKLRDEVNLTDFDRLKFEIRPGDVLLVEGRTRISRIIRRITQSCWTHSAIYVGTVAQHRDKAGFELLSKHWQGDEQEPLLLEGILGKGTIVTSLNDYQSASLRLCRPAGISLVDIDKVVDFVVAALGTEYDMRQLFDLARFLLPWPIMPRRWRSTLFNYKPGENTKTVCSSLIAEAFQAVHYPILPQVNHSEAEVTSVTARNPRLYTPADYDYSPYFDILKFPNLSGKSTDGYRNLPWVSNEENDDSD